MRHALPQLLKGIFIGLMVGLSLGAFAIYLRQGDQVDRLIYPIITPIFHPQPQGVSLGDWFFGCRDKRQCQ